jgi:hypothetical protein
MTIEHDDETDFEPWPAEVDPINTAFLPVIEIIFARTKDVSAEREAALGEVLTAIGRIRAALAPKPTIN